MHLHKCKLCARIRRVCKFMHTDVPTRGLAIITLWHLYVVVIFGGKREREMQFQTFCLYKIYNNNKCIFYYTNIFLKNIGTFCFDLYNIDGPIILKKKDRSMNEKVIILFSAFINKYEKCINLIKL